MFFESFFIRVIINFIFLVETSCLKRVAIVGPESTGKSDLARFLATELGTCQVGEYARIYLNKLNRPYKEADLLPIARGQIQEEDRLSAKAKKVLICDTNLVVIKIWSYIKYGRCNEEILNMLQSRYYDLHLLTFVDIPWKTDPQREHPDCREEIWRAYKNELITQKVPHIDIRGSRKQRRETALRAIAALTTIPPDMGKTAP